MEEEILNFKRIEYMQKCKHYSGYSGQCYKKSDSNNGWHLNMSCDCNCPRMKNYDKKLNKMTNEEWKKKNNFKDIEDYEQ
jgi:hypothetical protein